jgi:hypothetical protein
MIVLDTNKTTTEGPYLPWLSLILTWALNDSILEYSWSINSFSDHICIKGNQGHVGHLEVKIVSRPVMVYKVIRIKESHGQ